MHEVSKQKLNIQKGPIGKKLPIGNKKRKWRLK